MVRIINAATDIMECSLVRQLVSKTDNAATGVVKPENCCPIGHLLPNVAIV